MYASGEWTDDERHGRGKYTYVNGDVYDGEWRHGRRHGSGTYTYSSTTTGGGSHYYGQWKNGRQVGYGELVHANHKYYGRFNNNQVDTATAASAVGTRGRLKMRDTKMRHTGTVQQGLKMREMPPWKARRTIRGVVSMKWLKKGKYK